MPSARDCEVRIWWSGIPGRDCYIAQVVEWPTIMAHGETREEAALEIQLALEGELEIVSEEGGDIVAPRPHTAVGVAGA